MSIIISVFWGARREEILTCAERARRHFSALAAASENLAQWHAMGYRKPKTDDPIDVQSSAVLEILLGKGVNRKDIGREIIPELGFRISLWNGDRGHWSSSTHIGCGSYSKYVSNAANVKINFGSGIPPEVGMAQELLKEFIEIWEPSSGNISQVYMPPYEGDDIPESQDIPYASFWTSVAGGTEQTGKIETFGGGDCGPPPKPLGSFLRCRSAKGGTCANF